MVDRLTAYRLCLDPSEDQVKALESHAGASRWAFNLALSAKVEAHNVWRERVDSLISGGMEEAAARKAVKVRIPASGHIDKARVRVRGTDRAGNRVAPDWGAARASLLDSGIDPEVTDRVLASWLSRCADPAVGIQPWAPQVPNSVIQRGEKDADRAWKSWMDSITGRRAGKRVGYPRFKSRGKSRDSFYLTNTEVRLVEGRTRCVRLGGILGEIRCHSPLNSLRKSLSNGGYIESVTVSRGGSRWYASFLVKEDVPEPTTTRAQSEAGAVGVDLGVKVRAALSTGEVVPNPRLGKMYKRRLTKAQQALSRTERGSARRHKAARKVGNLQHALSEHRATETHRLTKRLATGWAVVGLEDLNVAGMTRSAAGTEERPGRSVKAKSGLNREILDVAPGEFRRQLEYKAPRYGSEVRVVDRWMPTSKMCSNCGVVKPVLRLSDRVFHCEDCGFTADRDVNAAINIRNSVV